MHGKVPTEQPDLSVLAVVSIHRPVPVLLVVGRYLIDRATVQFPLVAHLDPLTRVPLRLLPGTASAAVRVAVGLLVRRLGQGRLASAEGPTLQKPRAETLGFLNSRRCLGQRLRKSVRACTALRHRRRGRGYTLNP